MMDVENWREGGGGGEKGEDEGMEVDGTGDSSVNWALFLSFLVPLYEFQELTVFCFYSFFVLFFSLSLSYLCSFLVSCCFLSFGFL